MKRLILIILLLNLICAISVHAQNKKALGISIDSLTTGWYYIDESKFGIAKKLKGTDKVFFISPTPIITAKNFKKIEVYRNIDGDYGLSIKLDKKGKKEWKIATAKSIGNRLALIIDNELVTAPKVNMEIENGMTSYYQKGLHREELDKIKILLENEK